MIFGDNNTNYWYVLLLCLALALGGCSAVTGSDDDDDGDDGDGDDEPIEYSLSVSTDPSNGGSVDPSEGTYEDGTEVTVEATASNGWSFTGWTGDIESSDNPLTFEITSDTEMTANFEEQARAYRNQLEVTDGTNAEMLTFGMDENATSDFDEGMDDEAPPAPPNGSFYGHFVIEGYNLFVDYRPVTDEQIMWELHFGGEGDAAVTLSWDFDSSSYLGTLTLVDDPDNPSIEVDMGSESSYEASSDIHILYIVQKE